MFSIVIAPFYIPSGNAWGFQFFYVPTNTLYFLFFFFLSFFFFFDESHYSWYKLIYSWSFPGDTSGKEPSCQCRGHKRREFHLWVGRSHGGRHGKDWVPKNWCFWTVVLEKTLESPWTAKRSKQSILKEISPEYSLEGLMLKLKLQYFGHLMQRTDSFEKTLFLGKTESGRKRGRQGMRCLDSITDPMDMSFSKLWELVMDWEAWHIAVHGSQRVGHDWATELNSTDNWYEVCWILEKAMAPHSNTPAWKIPWMEESGRLQSMGLLKVGHNWATSFSCIGEGNGNSFHCSCLENPRDGGAW